LLGSDRQPRRPGPRSLRDRTAIPSSTGHGVYTSSAGTVLGESAVASGPPRGGRVANAPGGAGAGRHTRDGATGPDERELRPRRMPGSRTPEKG